jgi:5'-nucleotidase
MSNTSPANEEQLIALLDEYKISYSEWLKPVSSLLKELQTHDCYLKIVDQQLQRFVDVVRVKCFYKRDEDGSILQLIEEKQVFKDSNKERDRNLEHVAEKIRKDEPWIDAAIRALKEELQLKCKSKQLAKQLVHHPELDSTETYNIRPSYKGLFSIYRYINFSIEFNSDQYNASGYKEEQETKTTYFIWRQTNIETKTKNRPIILFDIDGVLTDFEDGCLKRWRIRYPTLPYIPREKRRGHDIREDYNRIDPSYGSLINAILRERDFFSELNLIEGALEILAQTEAAGYNVFICTTLLHNPSEMNGRAMWVKRTFGEYWATRVIMTRDKTLVRGDILIDDRPIIKGIAKPSFEHVIFDQPYNREQENQRIVGWNNWSSTLGTLKYPQGRKTECKRPVILVDISGVLANVEECYLRKWREYYPLFPFIPINKRNQHGIVEQYTSDLGPLYGQLMETLIHESDIYNTMALYKGAENILNEMEEEGYDVYICTRSFRDNANVTGKMQFIQRNFGQKWMSKTIISRDKSMIHADILIDDAPILKGCCKEPSFVHVLYDQPYNKESLTKYRIKDWGSWRVVISSVLSSVNK